MPQPLRIVDVTDTGQQHSAELYSILVRHAYLGVRVQFMLRAALIVFLAVGLLTVPPQYDQGVGLALVGGYAAWCVAVGVWTARGGDRPVRWMWVPLQVDTLALAAVIVVSGPADQITWTADLLTNGFFIIPLMAATALRPWVCAAVAAPAAVAYFAVSAAAKSANSEPWDSIILRTMVIVAIAAAGIALSRVQLSRVLTIGGLVADRSRLLAELLNVEGRERNTLAEELHDGALQYVLAARHDVDDARDSADPVLFERIDHALAEAAGLLRATVSRLHPAVLAQVGLSRALVDLCAGTAHRSGLRIDVSTDGWSDDADPRSASGNGRASSDTGDGRAGSDAGDGRSVGTSSTDHLVYGSARELLTNVVKHAHADRVSVTLRRVGRFAELVVADDGRGIPDGALIAQLERGHIGLASVRTRVEAGDGSMTIESAPGAGTTISVRVPYSNSPRRIASATAAARSETPSFS